MNNMDDPHFISIHYLMAHDVVDSILQDLAIQFQAEGGERWPREVMQEHINKRGALLLVKGLLLDEGERLLNS